MKILLVLHGFPPQTRGGTERVVEALARAMRAAGHDALVVAGSLEIGAPGDIGREDLAGLPVRRLQRDDLYHDAWFKAHSPGVSAAFARLLAEEQPDVVHVQHWIRTTTDLVRLARAAGCATVVTLHDYFTVLASPVRLVGQDAPVPPVVPGYVGGAEVAEAFEFHRRDLYADVCAAQVRCAPSRAHAEGVQQLAPGLLGPIEVTPPPLLQRPRRCAGAVARAGDRPRGRRLVTWGSLYAEKGLEVVLDALRRVGAGWELEVWGEAHEPAYRARLESLAAGLAVRFRGPFELADLEGIDADYAVLTSQCEESYGLTLDEAQLLGLPVLASDLPAYRERARADSVLLFPAGDAAALAALLRDDARLAALTTPPEPAVVSAAAAAERLLGLYERALAGDAEAAPAAPEVTDQERAAASFRRAERRLWTALQQDKPVAPPEDLLP